MKAAILYELDRPLKIQEEIEVPDLRRGQVLVKLAYSGVCHSQLMESRGRRGEDRYLPHLLGHEGSGVVLATGEGVTKVRAGDKVILGWIRGEGLDATGIRYRRGAETINAGAVTTFNDHAVVAENRCIALPLGVPMDVAVLFGCALPTGAGIVMNVLQPVRGSTIAVFGLGGIGLSALMACGLFDCAKVIAIDVSQEKLALAREFGATHTVDASRSNAVDEVRKLTGGAGADYAVEAAGSARTIEQAFDAVRRGGGFCVFASHPAQGERVTLDPYEMICGKRIAGSWGGECHPDRDVPKLAELYRRGKLPLEKLISRRYRLDDINQALDDLERGLVLRPLIEIDGSVGQDSA